MPGFPILHYLLEFAQTHVHWVSDAIQPSCPLSSPFPPCLQSFPASGSFLMSWLFVSGGQSIGASASALVLPMNIQDWFPLGLTGLISLQSKGLSNMDQVSSPIQALILLWHMISASFSLLSWRFLCCEFGNPFFHYIMFLFWSFCLKQSVVLFLSELLMYWFKLELLLLNSEPLYEASTLFADQK